MLDIATRTRVSKRDLYALFNNKHAVLAACISERAQRMRRPLDKTTPVPETQDALATLLVEFGVSILKTVCQPEVLTVFRLAIAESDRAPEIARALDSSGHEANQNALIDLVIWRVNSSPRGLKIASRCVVIGSDGSPTTSQEIWQRPSPNSCSKMRPISPSKRCRNTYAHALERRCFSNDTSGGNRKLALLFTLEGQSNELVAQIHPRCR